MAAEEPLLAHEEGPDDGSLLDLSTGNEAGLVLNLDDLLPDAGGEVVLSAEDTTDISLVTDHAVIESGQASAHVTASGIAVDGFGYHMFDNGMTVFFTPDLALHVVSGV